MLIILRTQEQQIIYVYLKNIRHDKVWYYTIIKVEQTLHILAFLTAYNTT
jgi:hypothetical protein